MEIRMEGFPSLDASNSEKKSMAYGKKAGLAIQGEWFRRVNRDSRFYSNRNEYQRLRLYARGEQPIGKYKKLMSFNGDLSYLNLDFSIVPIIPKFVDVVANGMTDRDFSIKAEAQDEVSNNKRKSYMKSLERDMLNKDFLLQAQELLGVNGFSNDYDTVPDTPEELDVHMQLTYKQSMEIAQEVAIESIMNENEFDDIRRRFNYDLVTLGMGAMKHDFTREGVKLRYVDPENFVYSYTEHPHFKDCYYFGEVRRENISELARRYQLNSKQLKKVQDNSLEWNDYHKLKGHRVQEFAGHVANVLYFNYKTTIETKVYKEKIGADGSKRYIEKDTDWNPPKEMLRGSKRVSKTDEVWFTGALVLGTDIMLEWEMEDNSIRPKSKHNKPLPKYVCAAPRNYEDRMESLVSRMIPFGDAIQMQHLKLQQVSARVLPDGVYLDVDGLVEIDLGNGKTYNPQEAFNMFMQTGSVIGRSKNTMGEYNHGSVPIKEIVSHSAHNKIASLIEQYNFHLARLRDVTGINEVRDGSTPDSDMLVGVQEMAVSNSNTATKHLTDASVNMIKHMAQGVSYRITDIVRNPETRKDFINKIGRTNVKILDDMKTMHLYDFGIFVELAPDVLERERIERDINLALQADKITIEDASVVRDIKNYKLAMRYLGVKIRKREEQIELNKQELVKAQAQEQLKLKQEEMKIAKEKATMEMQKEIAVEQTKGEQERLSTTHEANEKLRLMNRELEINKELEGIKSSAKREDEKYKQDRNDQRASRSNSEKSQLMKQHESKGDPIRFESNEDSLDGFSLGSFEPR